MRAPCRWRPALVAAALAGAAAFTVPSAAGVPAGHEALYIDARPGQRDAVERALGMGGLRVHRRLDDRLQVIAPPDRLPALRRLPGVVAARVATTAVPDQAPAPAPRLAISQGLQRTGAETLLAEADGGRGLVIAVLDLGFGTSIPGLQDAGELPPPSQLRTTSFDPVAGLAGANAYGNRTNHGELVAQTVFDYAPEARYLFVNYRTEADFVVATDWLTAQRPDIVVHSNNFLEGPFDGTNPLAQAVDRAADAGILWFNSAGNYARKHWTGQWSDPDADGDHDWTAPAWTFTRRAGQAMTFALSWTHNDPAAPTDLDLLIERETPDGAWTTVAASRDRQLQGARPSERLTGWRTPVEGRFRVRLAHVGGPVPGRPLTLFSREITLAAAAGSPVSSVPTPADAVGAVAVGAVTWRGDRLRNYSSWGPSDDGRLKPDLVAPTDTRVMGPNGLRGVGGTSNAAPNAAGAAALLIAVDRRQGLRPTASEVRTRLAETALDLGEFGPDTTYGAGRVRVAVSGPTIIPRSPRPGQLVRGVIRARFGVAGLDLTSWTLSLGDEVLRSRASRTPLSARLDTRTLADGVYVMRGTARDFPGNVADGAWRFRVDNTPPVVRVARPLVGPRGRPVPRSLLLRTPPEERPALRRRAAERPVRLRLVAVDPRARGALSARVALLGPRTRVLRSARMRSDRPEILDLGSVTRGRHRLLVRVTDRAGNARTVRKVLVVR